MFARFRVPILARAAVAGMMISSLHWVTPHSSSSGGEPAEGMTMKRENFDRYPSWLGVNNRRFHAQTPRMARQDFGYTADSREANGDGPGEIGGYISPDGEAAYYGKILEPVGFHQPLSASGTIRVGQGGTHLLIGFFNSNTVNEWRTPNTVALRINGRGELFFAYVEYCTAKWRAGGDTTPFPSVTDPSTGRWNLLGFPCDQELKWTMNYDPNGNEGKGLITATIGDAQAECKLDDSHKSDGATFNRFGIINVIKSVDSGSSIWLDDISIQGGPVESFGDDPRWEGRNNRQEKPSQIVRPWFDFGHSLTQFAGGQQAGELGGRIFRGDCRYPERLACYGDRVGPLTLDKPLKAAGKIALRRAVSDSTTLFGFYHSLESMQSNASQDCAVPPSVLGIHVEGPSRDGFRFYPVLRPRNARSAEGGPDPFPAIYPDGTSHDWSFAYDPHAANGHGRITVQLDDQSASLELTEVEAKEKNSTIFDRFGIITSWIDGNSQDIYWDDVSYTVSQAK